MALTALEPDVRTGFEEATEAFLSLVEAIPADAFGRPATDAWTVLELVAHTTRAFLATETVLATPLDPASLLLTGAAQYYRVALASPGAHAGIAARAVDGALVMADNPAGAVRIAAERVAPVVAATSDDREVQHLAGRLSFAEYLRTRVLELVLHGVDLQLALGWPATAPPEAARVSAALVLELADRADPLALACALAGRPVPGGCSVLS